MDGCALLLKRLKLELVAAVSDDLFRTVNKLLDQTVRINLTKSLRLTEMFRYVPYL